MSTAATPGRITRFYFMLQVADMDRAIGFYVGALGTELRHRAPELSEVHVGDVTICLKAGAPAGRRATGLMLEGLVVDLPEPMELLTRVELRISLGDGRVTQGAYGSIQDSVGVKIPGRYRVNIAFTTLQDEDRELLEALHASKVR